MNTSQWILTNTTDVNHKLQGFLFASAYKISVCPNSMMQTGQNVLDKKWYFPIVSKLIKKLLYTIVLALL